MNHLNLKINLKYAAISLIAVSAVAISYQQIKPAKAAAAGVLTGKYGCVQNKNFPGYIAKFSGSSNWGVNGVYVMDFDAGTITGVSNSYNGFETSSPSTSQAALNATFTAVLNPVINGVTATGIVQTTVTGIGNNNIGYGVVVNGGNTILTAGGQTTSAVDTGVCQKI